MSVFTAKLQPAPGPPTHSHTHTPSTPPTHPEIVFLLGHLSRVGSCRCCWRLWSWEEVPATPKSKCFFFHFPVLVSFFFFYLIFFRSERRGGIPLGMIGTRFVGSLFLEHRKPCLMCMDFFVSFKRRILCFGGIPVYFDYRKGEAKSLKTSSDTYAHMHCKRVTHSIVRCTAEFNWDLLWAWELMPACTEY